MMAVLAWKSNATNPKGLGWAAQIYELAPAHCLRSSPLIYRVTHNIVSRPLLIHWEHVHHGTIRLMNCRKLAQTAPHHTITYRSPRGHGPFDCRAKDAVGRGTGPERRGEGGGGAGKGAGERVKSFSFQVNPGLLQCKAGARETCLKRAWVGKLLGENRWSKGAPFKVGWERDGRGVLVPVGNYLHFLSLRYEIGKDGMLSKLVTGMWSSYLCRF